MNTERWRDSLSRDLFKIDLENLSWPRILWILAASFLGGWLAWTSPEFTEARDRRIYDRLLQYTPSSFKYPMIQITAGAASFREGPSLPWPRSMHARLLQHLKEARLVLLDMPLEKTTSPEEDEALVLAVREHGRVLGRSHVETLQWGGSTVEEPFPVLRDSFLRVGVDNRKEDRDGVSRRGVWGVEDITKMKFLFLPSLALTAAEELDPSIVPLERGDLRRVRLPWKTLHLERSPEGLVLFRINHPRTSIPSYEYTDVLNGRVSDASFANAVVVVSFDDTERRREAEKFPIGRERTVSKGEFVLHTIASLMDSFSFSALPRAIQALLTFLLVAASTLMGFVHFKKSLVFLLLLLTSCFTVSVGLFLQFNLGFPLSAVFLASAIGYIGSQVALSWHLDREWNVRSLSIRPLLELARKTQTDIDEGLNFDDYLRSMWNDIEDATGVELKSTRIGENFSLVQSYLQRASRTSELGQEFLIIHNAADSPPRHRMLLPLPMWGDSNRSKIQEYSIMGWDGRIPTETLGSLAALTLFAAVHYHAMEESRRRKDMLIKTIEAIMMAVEAKDTTTSEHSRRVAAISKKLAQWMRLPPQEVDDIYFSAIIHDIGKLGISDKVLNKPGRLNDEELAEMRRHPLIGESIMRPVDLPAYVMSGILQHHERHDGKGYPHGIPGEEMTMAGRIIKVADVFDALVNRRQYKEPWTEEKVRNLLLELRGTEFDPQIVDIFIRNLYQTKNNPMFYYGIQL